MKKEKVWVLLTSNVLMPERDPDVHVFSSEKKMEKFVKLAVNKRDFKEFKENFEVTTANSIRYFYYVLAPQ